MKASHITFAKKQHPTFAKALHPISASPLHLSFWCILTLSCLAPFLASCSGGRWESVVFASGCDGYRSYRIPAIVRLPGGDLLAFCEGRADGSADFGNIQIVMKRSRDGGRTWGSMSVVASNGSLQTSNPAPVLDTMDPAYPGGRLLLFYNTGDASERDILNGRGFKRCWYVWSADMGQSWSEPVEITRQVFLANRPDIDSTYSHPDDWRYYANTPGHAIQLQRGPNRGRIYVAANHSYGPPQPHGRHYMAHGYYTDDHGSTFKLGSNIEMPGSNESMAVELSDGTLMMNSRNQRGDIRARIVTISRDGGRTWGRPTFDTTLPDPVCQGSIADAGGRGRRQKIVFCNNADTLSRNNLTLRVSLDDGRTWSRSCRIYGRDSLADRNDWSGYSDITPAGHGKVGILYERDNYSEIVYTTVKP